MMAQSSVNSRLTDTVAALNSAGMDYAEACARLSSTDWRIALGGGEAQLGRNAVEQLTWMQNKAATRTARLPHDFHQVWYALVVELRRMADLHEHQAMRDLHERRGRSWQQVARGLGLETASRQRVQQRFDRLGDRLGEDVSG